MIDIKQHSKHHLVQTRKTVEWLVNHTEVAVFDPITFQGYQRQIDDKHCAKIVDFLKKDDFFLPTAIVCAVNGILNEDTILRIVDGQHRVEAFKMLQSSDMERYQQIKDFEVPVIILVDVDETTEIDTFITINKTSKKVDTSLALVLRNKINKYSDPDTLSISKAEYVAVELAQELCFNETPQNLWANRILFEGSPKNTYQLISLNAFVKSTRQLLNKLHRCNLISLSWTNQAELENCLNTSRDIITFIWQAIRNRWPKLFGSHIEDQRIIQGAIGYSAFNRVIIHLIDSYNIHDVGSLLKEFTSVISNISISEEKWLPGGEFSKYSSESGYRIVAQELLRYME